MIQLLAAESQLENGTVIWERALQPAFNGLYKLQMKCELNKASTLEFVVSPECPYYEQFHLYKTRLTLVDQIDGANGDVFYFHGRVTKIKSDSFGQKTITAESFMSYLADGVWIAAKPDENEKWYYIKDPDVGWKHVEKAEYDAAKNVQKEQRKAHREVQAKKTFEDAVNLYNLGRTSGDYRIEVGDATQFATAKHDDSSKDGSGDLFSKINDDCIKYHGGYLRERVAHRNGGGYTLYLDYVKNYGHTCGQTLEFGKQIISIDREDTSKEFFTSLVAMGDNYTLFQIPTNMTYNVNVTKADGTKMPIQVQVVAGSPYFDIPEALAFAGTRIVHLETFSGVGGTKDKPSPYDLLQPALDYISNNYKPELQSYKVKAVDMHLLDDSVDRIMLGYVVPIIPKFSATAVSLTCTAIDFDFTALENTVFTIGVPDQTLTQKYSSTEQSSKKTGRKASATAATVDELSDTFDVHKRRISLIADEEIWEGLADKSAFFTMKNGEITVNAKSIMTAADYLLTEITQQDLEIVRNRMSSSTGTTVDTIYQRIFGKDGIGFFGTTKEALGLGDLVRTNQADIGANSRKFNSYYYADQIDEKLKDYGDELKALANKQDIRWSKYESELQQTAKNLHGYVKQTRLQGIDDYEIELVDPTENPSGMELYELVDGKYVPTTDTKPIMAEDFDDVRSVTLRESDNPKEMGMYEAVTTSGGKTTYQLSEDTKPYKETYTLYHPTPYELQYVVYDFGDDTTASPKSLKLYERAVGGYVKTEDTTQTQGKKYYILESPAALGLYQSKISGGATTYILSQDTSQVAGRSYYKAWNPSELELYELKEGKYILSTDTTPQPNKVYYQWGKQAKQYYRVPLKQKAYYKANSRATSIGDIVSGFDALYDSTQMFSKATGIVLDSNGNPTKTWTEYTAWKDGETPVSLRLYELKDGTGEGTDKPAEYILTSDSERKTGKKYYTWEYVFDQNSSNTILSKIGTTLNKAYLMSAINGDTIDHVEYDSTNQKWIGYDADGNVVQNFTTFASVSTDATGDVFINAINNRTNNASLTINADKLNIRGKTGSGISIDENGNINITATGIVKKINSGTATIKAGKINIETTTGATGLYVDDDKLKIKGLIELSTINFTTSSTMNENGGSSSSNANVDNSIGLVDSGAKFKYLNITGHAHFGSSVGISGDLTPTKIKWYDNSGKCGGNFFEHYHHISAAEQFTGEGDNRKSTGQVKITIEKPTLNANMNNSSFDIAATKFYKDAIAAAKTNASVASIAYNGSATPGLSVGRTQTGSSAQTIVLNNVPLTLTLYGTEEVDGKTVAITQAHTVSGIELPSVSFQNGSGGTPAIAYVDGKPTIDVKAVMSGTTIKSAETYTGNAITLRPSFTAPSASTANKTFTLVAYDGTTISNDTKITSKDVTLQHEIGQIMSNNKKYLRVRTNTKNDSGESSSPVFYTDYQITWNSDTIQNTNGSSSVTAKVSINGVQYDSHTFTGKYATAESDNETVRANGWAAALNALNYSAPSSETLDFGEAKTVYIQKRATEGAALTDIFRRTYTAPDKPTINAPTLNTGTINYTTKSVQGGTQFYVQAPIKVTTSVENLGSTGTVDVPIGATVDDATITYDATTGKPTVTANVKVAGVSNAYLATKTFDGTAPKATLSAGTITEKSGKLPILAKMGNVQIGSNEFAITMSGSDIGNFTDANTQKQTTIQAKYGNYVLAEKVVKAKFTGSTGGSSLTGWTYTPDANTQNYTTISNGISGTNVSDTQTLYIVQQKDAQGNFVWSGNQTSVYLQVGSAALNAPIKATCTVDATARYNAGLNAVPTYLQWSTNGLSGYSTVSMAAGNSPPSTGVTASWSEGTFTLYLAWLQGGATTRFGKITGTDPAASPVIFQKSDDGVTYTTFYPSSTSPNDGRSSAFRSLAILQGGNTYIFDTLYGQSTSEQPTTPTVTENHTNPVDVYQTSNFTGPFTAPGGANSVYLYYNDNGTYRLAFDKPQFWYHCAALPEKFTAYT